MQTEELKLYRNVTRARNFCNKYNLLYSDFQSALIDLQEEAQKDF